MHPLPVSYEVPRGAPWQLILLAAFVFSSSAIMIFSKIVLSAFLVPHVLCPATSCCTSTDQLCASVHVGTGVDG